MVAEWELRTRYSLSFHAEQKQDAGMGERKIPHMFLGTFTFSTAELHTD